MKIAFDSNCVLMQIEHEGLKVDIQLNLFWLLRIMPDEIKRGIQRLFYVTKEKI